MDYYKRLEIMKLKTIVIYFLIAVSIFVLWKLTVIESGKNSEYLYKLFLNSQLYIPGVDKLQILREALDLHKDELQLSQEQLLLLEQLGNKNMKVIPTIYAITPTYARFVQKAELTRLSQTLRLVPSIHWIVVEDAGEKSNLVKNLIKESKLVTTHLNAKTPPFEKLKAKVRHTNM